MTLLVWILAFIVVVFAFVAAYYNDRAQAAESQLEFEKLVSKNAREDAASWHGSWSVSVSSYQEKCAELDDLRDKLELEQDVNAKLAKACNLMLNDIRVDQICMRLATAVINQLNDEINDLQADYAHDIVLATDRIVMWQDITTHWRSEYRKTLSDYAQLCKEHYELKHATKGADDDAYAN